jgi:hypothetical protein
MKTRMTILTILASGILSFAFASGTARRSAKPLRDPISVPCPSCRINFGVLGITGGQTARLNVVSLTPPPEPDRSTPPPEPERPVQVELMFFDSQGNVLLRSTETLMPGHAAFLDLDGATLPRGPADTFPPVGGISNRTQIRAKIRLIEDPNLGEPPEPDRNRINLAATVEVFDNFGLDAGKTRMGWTQNHNETLVRDTARAKRARR